MQFFKENEMPFVLLHLKSQKYFQKYCESAVLLKCPQGQRSLFETFSKAKSTETPKTKLEIPNELLDGGFFDAFHLEIFKKGRGGVTLKRIDQKPRVFNNIVSDQYDFISSEQKPKKCSNNYFLTGQESEDLLEIFKVLHFDGVQFAGDRLRPIPDFHLFSLLKKTEKEDYMLLLGDEDEEERQASVIQQANENQSFMSLANNSSFVCLDVAESESGTGIKAEVSFIVGNEGLLKENFLEEVRNIFLGNNR